MDKQIITVLSTSDTHGYFYPTDFRAKNQQLEFGQSRAFTAVEDLVTDHSIVIDNGDFLQGSPMSYYLAKKKNSQMVANMMNSFGYDVGVLGNHEFNYGLDYLYDVLDKLNYPVVCANILNKSGESITGKPYVILNRGDLKVAVLGLTTQYIPNWEQPSTIEGLTFRSVVETAKEFVPKLREEADMVVVAYHGGFEKDLVTGEPTETLTGENEGYDLLHEVPGIDVLVTGHQHREIATIVNDVAVTQPGDKGRFVGKVESVFDTTTRKVISSTASLVPSAAYESSKKLTAPFSSLLDEVEEWLDQPLGTIEGDMTISDPMAVRKFGHAYIEFINDVQMEVTGTDISGTALFDNNSLGFKEQVTMRDIVTNYIYPNTLAVLKVTGKDLKDALEQSAGYFAYDGKTISVSDAFLEPKPEHYNYDMYSGISYIIDLKQDVGQRIKDLTYKNKTIENNDILEIVINQYRAVGGGNYEMFEASKIIKEVTVDMTELISNYLQAHPNYKVKTNHTFSVKIDD